MTSFEIVCCRAICDRKYVRSILKHPGKQNIWLFCFSPFVRFFPLFLHGSLFVAHNPLREKKDGLKSWQWYFVLCDILTCEKKKRNFS